jgi:hypothetical protein
MATGPVGLVPRSAGEDQQQFSSHCRHGHNEFLVEERMGNKLTWTGIRACESIKLTILTGLSPQENHFRNNHFLL